MEEAKHLGLAIVCASLMEAVEEMASVTQGLEQR
jgi:hypothetical protein